MKLRGRVTVYGEAFGSTVDYATLSVPTRQALAMGPEAAVMPKVDNYRREIDDFFEKLTSSKVIDPLKVGMVAGDLPVGYGLAASTVLGLLCFGASDRPTAYASVMNVDKELDGFAHSGADFWAITTQQPGVFGRGTWTPVSYALPAGSHLLIPEREGKCSKLSATLAIRAMREKLAPLIGQMSGMVLRGKSLDTELLLTYCRTLISGGVYSKQQSEIISALCEKGIVAKGTGAMYDRAILVLASESVWNGDPPLPLFGQ